MYSALVVSNETTLDATGATHTTFLEFCSTHARVASQRRGTRGGAHGTLYFEIEPQHSHTAALNFSHAPS